MSVVELTREYESWLASVIPYPLVTADLDHKHQLMADAKDPFPFFRGTYYLWAKHWAGAAGDLVNAAPVLSVGDIHVENYGTWRDADGRLCWGVNDFDETDDLPWTHDLVRLAASVRAAKRGKSLRVKLSVACERILSGYTEAMRAGGMPFVLEEHHPELREMAMHADRDPVQFWAKLTKLLRLPEADPPPAARAALAADRPPGLSEYFLRPRPEAGVGSLGRPRFVGMAEWRGGWVCREAKAIAPPATAWVLNTAPTCRIGEVVNRAVRSHDPFYRELNGWVARRLAPRASKIELDLLEEVNVNRLLFAMGAEVANVHLGTTNATEAILPDLDRRPQNWLLDAARSFANRLEADWEVWREAR
ncbi:MAG: DUF2252 domain-containing protein [Fimbriiglobus sp.]|jgi:hypothetical protein|nr:DUF2252 domain-containing protein [Fimbriiglobus sp.]